MTHIVHFIRPQRCAMTVTVIDVHLRVKVISREKLEA